MTSICCCITDSTEESVCVQEDYYPETLECSDEESVPQCVSDPFEDADSDGFVDISLDDDPCPY